MNLAAEFHLMICLFFGSHKKLKSTILYCCLIYSSVYFTNWLRIRKLNPVSSAWGSAAL